MEPPSFCSLIVVLMSAVVTCVPVQTHQNSRDMARLEREDQSRARKHKGGTLIDSLGKVNFLRSLNDPDSEKQTFRVRGLSPQDDEVLRVLKAAIDGDLLSSMDSSYGLPRKAHPQFDSVSGWALGDSNRNFDETDSVGFDDFANRFGRRNTSGRVELTESKRNFADFANRSENRKTSGRDESKRSFADFANRFENRKTSGRDESKRNFADFANRFENRKTSGRDLFDESKRNFADFANRFENRKTSSRDKFDESKRSFVDFSNRFENRKASGGDKFNESKRNFADFANRSENRKTSGRDEFDESKRNFDEIDHGALVDWGNNIGNREKFQKVDKKKKTFDAIGRLAEQRNVIHNYFQYNRDSQS